MRGIPERNASPAVRAMKSAALCALLFVATAVHANDPSSAIRELFAAYANNAPPQWADHSTTRDAFERAMHNAHRVHCLTVGGLQIGEPRVDGDEALARVAVLVTNSVHIYDVTLARQRNEWRVRDAALAVEKLSDALIDAKSESERRALLAQNPELLSPDLVRLLIRRAYVLVSTNGRVGDAARAGQIAGGIATEIGDDAGIALHLCVRSVVASAEGRLDESNRLGHEALDAARRAGDADAIARALVTAASSTKGPDGQALLAEAASLEPDVEDLGVISRAYNLMQGYAWDRDDFVMLRTWIDEELRLAAAAGDTLGVTRATVNLSAFYNETGDPDACVQFAQRAVETVPVRPTGLFTIATLLELRCRRLRGERDGLRPRILEALQWARQLQRPIIESDALLELAYHHFLAGEYDQRVRESLALLTRRETTDEHYVLLARAHLARGRHAEVLEAMEQFRAVSERLSYSAIIGTYVAKAHRALGDTGAALADLDAAMTASEQYSAHLIGDEPRRAMALRDAADPFVEAVDLNVELGRVDVALACAERGRGRVLLGSVSGGPQRVRTSMTAEERIAEERLERELATLNRALLATNANDAVRERLARARVELETFRAALYVRHPELQKQRGAIAVASTREITSALPQDSVFLEYVVGETRTHVFVVSPAGVVVRTLPVGRATLEEKVTAYRMQLARRALSQRKTARELDRILLAPLDDVLRTKRVLGIVADGVLWQVPFEALVDARGRYRVETHTIFYAPSISIHLAMHDASRRRESRAHPTLLAVADPIVSDVVRRRLHEVYRSMELTPLPDARVEVATLREIYGRDASRVYAGAAATETRVKEEIGDRDVVHFATHGILDDTSPMYSRLVLAQAKNATGSDADGLLEAWELMDLDLDADLVVLSSCDSARGLHSAGEGMIGMTWAAFVAGARTTVASLWPVSSKSTSTLMVDFHRELRAHPQTRLAKAEALRRAKLRMLRSEGREHPFYWAAFVAIGDP